MTISNQRNTNLVGVIFLFVLSLSLSVSTKATSDYTEDIKKAIKDGNRSKKGIAGKLCSANSNYDFAATKKSVASEGKLVEIPVTAQENCMKTLEEIAGDYLKDDNKDTDGCDEVNKEFHEIAVACSEIGNFTKIISKSKAKKMSYLYGCQQSYSKCFDVYTGKDKSADEGEKEACSFLAVKGKDDDYIDSLGDKVREAKMDLSENMAESQKKAQDDISARQEQVREMQQSLQEGLAKIQQAEQAIVDLNYELENEETKIDLNLKNEVLQLRSQLDLAQGQGLFDVEAQYDRRLQEEKQACLSEGTNEYNEYKKMLQATNASGKGVTNSQISKYTSKSPAEWASYFSTRCLNSTSYLAKVKQYNQERVSALAAKKNEIQTIEAQITLKIEAAQKQVISLAKSGQIKKQKAIALRNQLMQSNSQLQQRISQLQRPDQSLIMQQMQQQQTFMQEMQHLQEVDTKYASLKNISISSDQFDHLQKLKGMAPGKVEDAANKGLKEVTDLEEKYLACYLAENPTKTKTLKRASR
ncbi:MAG: hypothetical protein VX642_07145 [Bdellovibrionota bacterium]|nr:hypothetical protein [Bdellovibrionota bacterium]